ncbi:MAG: hypothetical protein WC806_01295 [Candidatus Gracilibacteria bacterium]|jgi:hypothetical protein
MNEKATSKKSSTVKIKFLLAFGYGLEAVRGRTLQTPQITYQKNKKRQILITANSPQLKKHIAHANEMVKTA